MDKTNAENKARSSKGALWSGLNIGAGILIVAFLVRFVGNMIFGKFVSGNFFLGLILGIVFLLVGVWLGSIFGVNYVSKRSRINPTEITKISTIAALLPVVFLLFWTFLDVFTAEEFVFPTETLVATIIGAVAAFFLVKRSLKGSIRSFGNY